MSNFYLKIKKRDNEIEISTDDEKIFNEKIEEILKGFKTTDNIFEQAVQQIQKEEDLCGFVEIEKPAESVNEIQDIDGANKTLTEEFEQILENAQNTPTIEFSEPENSNEEFNTFVSSQNPQSEMDYLIFSALYFLKYLQKQNFTLKQINSKLVPTKNVAIGHRILKESIEQGFVEEIPDLTQTSVTKEYRLTQKGEFEYRIG